MWIAGPCKQLKNMFAKTRCIATTIYLLSIATTVSLCIPEIPLEDVSYASSRVSASPPHPPSHALPPPGPRPPVTEMSVFCPRFARAVGVSPPRFRWPRLASHDAPMTNRPNLRGGLPCETVHTKAPTANRRGRTEPSGRSCNTRGCRHISAAGGNDLVRYAFFWCKLIRCKKHVRPQANATHHSH